MIVNDIPGEECRIAILQDQHLEELYTERQATATDVGNIYKGRVINVEPAIQAAFIDYGQGANGFLHISDLHPRYFPGEERTERVGKKIPRRERPSMQTALRRGQEILVQVLKEGIGTKGPTLTSYLSIPGRLLVMMPDMDRVGVSRKVEDEQKRREMRQILDSLNLPDGFGFILRTAGFGKTKTELKRDAAYLMRLWKVMEKRIKGIGAPCELYTESDLLIRTIRDVVRPSIKAIVVDSESAYDRVMAFLHVIAPRTAPRVIRYNRAAPIFHAFDIERQIELIHAREVPLASGGRLVIDQTEALVAIDVNSGRSRSARDSETNAYETNIEACDEICRQLRLRDLGGLIVNDLIDMRSIKHRKAIEERFTTNFKRDRARTTIAPISEFGILEMTRQRMRPSLRKSHYMDCPHCNGHGEIKVPESVAADAVRHTGFLLQYERVRRVEIACSGRVASVLLSAKRRELVRMEDATDKRIDVRVSDAIAVDRVDFYAYDDRNADIDISRLPPLQMPRLEELEKDQMHSPEIEADDGEETVEAGGQRRRRRRGGRGRSRGPADATAIALAGGFDEELEALGYDEEQDDVIAGEQPPASTADTEELGRQAPHGQPGQPGEGRRRRRRRRRGRRGGGGGEHVSSGNGAVTSIGDRVAAPASAHDLHHPEHGSLDESGELAVHPTASPMRVHELARELNVSASEVMQRAEPDPDVHHLSSPLATVSPQEADAIRQMFADAPGEGVASDSSPPPSISATAFAGSADFDEAGPAEPGASGAPGSGRKRRRRRRRGRGGRGGANGGEPVPQTDESSAADGRSATSAADESSTVEFEAADDQQPSSRGGAPSEGEGGGRKRRRRRRRGRGGNGSAVNSAGTGESGLNGPSSEPPAASAPLAGAPSAPPPESTSSAAPASPPKKPRRALYRAGRVAVTSRREGAAADDE